MSYLAENSDFPIVIIKDPIVRQKKKDGKYRFGVCFDSSFRSKAALRQVLSMMRPDDFITCIVVKEDGIKLTTVESSIASICAEFNVTHQRVKVLEREDHSQSVYKCIKNYLILESHEGNYIDFIACGNNGVNFAKKAHGTLGAVANAIVRAPMMNVIFCPQ